MTTLYTNKQVLLRRGNTAVSSVYTGPVGEVTVDTDLSVLRVHDGVTPGGHLVAASSSGSTPPAGAKSNSFWYDDIGGRLYIFYDGAWVDASPAGDLLLNANVAALASAVANVETHITSLDANIGSFENTVTGTVNTINANINTLNETVAGFEANAGPTSAAWTSDNPPDISNVGALWYDDVGGRLYVRYDGTWVDASPPTTADGTLTVPGTITFPRSFTAVFDEAHYGNGPFRSLTGPATTASITFTLNRGDIEIHAVPQTEPTPAGYAVGDYFNFTEADHGIPGYTLSILFDQINNYPNFPRTVYSPAPTYIPSIKSDGTVSVQSGTNVWQFGSDGNLTLPNGDITIGYDPYGDPAIIGAAGKNIAMIASGVGDGYEIGSSLIWVDSITEPTKIAGVTANNPLYVGAGDVGIVTGDYFYTGNTNVWNFGADGTLTVPGAITMPVETGLYSPGHNLYITAGNTTGCSVPGGDTIISSGLGYGGAANNGGNVTLRTGDYHDKVWNFDYNGTLTIPGDIISTAGPAITFDTTFNSNIAPGLHVKASKLTFIADSAYLNDIVENTLPFNGVPAMSWNMEGEVLTWTANSEIFASTSIFKMPHSDSANVGVIAMTGPSGGSELSWHGGSDYGRPIGQFIKSSANVSIATNGGFNWWIFGDDGNLTLPAGGDIRDSVSNISVLKTRIGDTYASGAFQQLTIAHDEGKLITIGGGNSLFRLPQITSNSLGMEFEFYFSGDSGQIYIQAFYTGSRGTTDKFVGSLCVGVDNSAQGRLHTATAGVADANYLFLGQHHAKTGSYIRFKAIAFGSVGTWLVQGQCVGDTVNTTPNGQSYMFQNYYD